MVVAVAVQAHGPDGDASARVLLETALMRVFGFEAGEAGAWLRLVCPPPRTTPEHLSAALRQRTGGWAQAAVTDARRSVLIIVGGRRVVVSPLDPQGFVAAVRDA